MSTALGTRTRDDEDVVAPATIDGDLQHGGSPRSRIEPDRVDDATDTDDGGAEGFWRTDDDQHAIDGANEAPSAYELFHDARTLLTQHHAITPAAAIEFLDQVAEFARWTLESSAGFAWIEEGTPFHDLFEAVFPDDTIAEPGTPGDAVTRLVVPAEDYAAGVRLMHSKAPRDGEHHCSMHATFTSVNTDA